MTRFRLHLIASLLALPLLALSACGGDDNEESVDKLLDEAFSTPIKSANMTLDTELELEGVDVSGPVRLKLSGPYRDNGPAKLPSFDWKASVTGGGVNFNGGLISTGDNVFVNYQDEDYELGEQTVKQVNDAAERARRQQGDQGSLKSLGIDPRSWVKNGKDEGTEEVAGVETTHISGELDVPNMIDDLNKLVEESGEQIGGQVAPAPKPLSDDQKEQIEDAVGEPKFDLYVGKEDKAIRRLSTDASVKVPEDERDDIGGLEKAEIGFSIQFADVGDRVQIRAPSDARPLSQLIGQIIPGLGGGLPGPGGGSGGSGGSGLVPPPGGSTQGSGSAAETRRKLRRFQECVARANPNDTAARQRCLELLR